MAVSRQGTLLPTNPPDAGEDNNNAAIALLRASTDLMLALQRMPGPIWELLNDRHAAENHAALAPLLDCVPCQFDRVLAVNRSYDAEGRRQTQYRDPAELFRALVPTLRREPWEDVRSKFELKGTRTGRITVEDDGAQVYQSEFGCTPSVDSQAATQALPVVEATIAVEGGQDIHLGPGEIVVKEVEG